MYCCISLGARIGESARTLTVLHVDGYNKRTQTAFTDSGQPAIPVLKRHYRAATTAEHKNVPGIIERVYNRVIQQNYTKIPITIALSTSVWRKKPLSDIKVQQQY